MKRLKKMMAFIVAAVMILSTMNMAFADPTETTPPTSAGDLAVDAEISITGLSVGDTVSLYKVLEWVDGAGWRVVQGFEDLLDETDGSAGVKALVANTPNTQLSAEDLAKIATAAQGKTPVNDDYDTPLTGTTFKYTANEPGKAGMYVAFVTAGEAGVVYNPIVISADFTADNETSTIPASSVINGTAVAKKKKIDVFKTEPDITGDDGATFDYTIETTIPVYSAAFTNQFFTVTDKLSEFLDITDAGVTVETKDGTHIDVTSYLTIDDDKHGFTLTFDHDYVSALQAAQDIVITYSAQLNVPFEELTNVTVQDNDVTVTFPNNPNDLTGKKVTAVKDSTREYTFTIDGNLFGDSTYRTAELVKIGVDAEGRPVESPVEVSNGTTHAALQGARFGVFTTEAAAQAAWEDPKDDPEQMAGIYSNSVFDGIVTTDKDGLMKIAGLNAGTPDEPIYYYVAELHAPAGYIRTDHIFEIGVSAVITEDPGEAVTEYYTADEQGVVTWHDTQVDGSIPYTYYVPVLESYTITVDGAESVYEMTLSGPNISTVTPADSSTDIRNTKGVELPATGGIGTTIFYVIGSILVLGAGILLVTRRRMSAN